MGVGLLTKAHGPSVLLLPLKEREQYSLQAQDGLTFQAAVTSKSGEEYGRFSSWQDKHRDLRLACLELQSSCSLTTFSSQSDSR